MANVEKSCRANRAAMWLCSSWCATMATSGLRELALASEVDSQRGLVRDRINLVIVGFRDGAGIFPSEPNP